MVVVGLAAAQLPRPIEKAARLLRPRHCRGEACHQGEHGKGHCYPTGPGPPPAAEP